MQVMSNEMTVLVSGGAVDQNACSSAIVGNSGLGAAIGTAAGALVGSLAGPVGAGWGAYLGGALGASAAGAYTAANNPACGAGGAGAHPLNVESPAKAE